LQWQAVGIIGILTGLYTGQGFIGNLGAAVRAQLHDDFDDAVPEKSFISKILGNVVTLIGLIIGLLLAVALTVVGTGLRSIIADFLGLSGFAASLLFVVPVILTFGAAWLIFWFLFTMLPEKPVDKQAKNRGSLIGATAFLILINFSTVLVNLFSGNKAAGVFGSIIAIMLTLNVFARIILFIAAWIGTAKPPRPRRRREPRVPVRRTEGAGAEPRRSHHRCGHRRAHPAGLPATRGTPVRSRLGETLDCWRDPLSLTEGTRPLTDATTARLDDWAKKQTAAEELIPLVGRLYRENDVLLTLFGRSLLNKSVTGMIKAHRYARHFLGEELDIQITHRIVKALSGLNLAPARIDLGRLIEKLDDPNADVDAFLAAELAEVVQSQSGQGRSPRRRPLRLRSHRSSARPHPHRPRRRHRNASARDRRAPQWR
jgi:inner membrane protein YhjD